MHAYDSGKKRREKNSFSAGRGEASFHQEPSGRRNRMLRTRKHASIWVCLLLVGLMLVLRECTTSWGVRTELRLETTPSLYFGSHVEHYCTFQKRQSLLLLWRVQINTKALRATAAVHVVLLLQQLYYRYYDCKALRGKTCWIYKLLDLKSSGRAKRYTLF